MSRVDQIGERDGWRCWLCDEAVDALMSVNDPRGPSVDSVTTRVAGKAKGVVVERLAHRACNTRKGAVTAVVAWPVGLFVVDPAPILPTVDSLRRKGGRAVMARCPTRADAAAAAAWLDDRVSRLSDDVLLRARVEPGGGQFVVVLQA
jgi:hypothetical protein